LIVFVIIVGFCHASATNSGWQRHYVFRLSIWPAAVRQLALHMTRYLCTWWRDFNETCYKYSSVWVGTAENVFKVRVQS